MKKVVKFAFKTVLWLAVILLVLLLALPLWIGPVGTRVANCVVPRITGTPFHLGELGLNPYAGTLSLGDMQLANPEGFSEKNAVELTKFDAAVSVESLVSGKKYHVKNVNLDGLVIYSDMVASNFRIIADNVAGEPAECEQGSGEVSPGIKEEPKAEEKPAKGYQIDYLGVDNVTLKLGMVPIKVPVKIELKDIGADSEEGASLEEVFIELYASVMSAAGAVGSSLKDLGKGTFDAVKAGGTDLKSVVKDVKLDGESIKGASKSLKDASKNIKDLFK